LLKLKEELLGIHATAQMEAPHYQAFGFSNCLYITNTVTETMGNNGRKLVADKYEIKLVTSKVVELYQKVFN
jgi:hypothetical protein